MAPGIWQIMLIVLVVLLLFGTGKVPRIMEDLAKGIKSFKKGMRDEDDEQRTALQNKSADDDDIIEGEKADRADKVKSGDK